MTTTLCTAIVCMTIFSFIQRVKINALRSRVCSLSKTVESRSNSVSYGLRQVANCDARIRSLRQALITIRNTAINELTGGQASG